MLNFSVDLGLDFDSCIVVMILRISLFYTEKIKIKKIKIKKEKMKIVMKRNLKNER